MGVVGHDDGAGPQVRLGGRELTVLVFIGVQAVVQEDADVPQRGELVDRAPDLAVDDARPRLADQVPGVGVDVDRGQVAVPVAQQGGGDDAGAEAQMGAGLHHVLRLGRADQGVPAGPAAPVRFGSGDAPERIGRQPPGQLASEVLVLVQFLHPGPDLLDLGPGDRGHEPAELIQVAVLQVVGVVVSLAVVHQPVDRPSDDASVVTRHGHGPQRQRGTPAKRRRGEPAPQIRLHRCSPPKDV